MGMAKTGLRSVVLVGVGALLLAACGGGDSGNGGGSGDTSGGTKGGTLRFLNLETQFLHLDPQRNYTGEDLAFASGYMQRTLVSYTYVEGADGWALVPDLATDTGTPNEDGSSWEFTLQDGVNLVNARLGINFGKSNSSLTLWGRNITDERWYHGSADLPVAEDGMFSYPDEPATYGVTYRKAFD